jgi:peptidoglycan-associated lipoprotein
MLKTSTSTLLCALILMTMACHHRRPAHPVDTDTAETSKRQPGADNASGTGTAGQPQTSDDLERQLGVDPIYFEFDSSELSSLGRDELTGVASWMQRRPGSHLRIEGHTDDRGTTEYNIALGDRRAQVIADFLYRLGVERERLQTISFGEERPAVEGESEDAWAKNRRGALDVQH